LTDSMVGITYIFISSSQMRLHGKQIKCKIIINL
jgi:hypothetical protein